MSVVFQPALSPFHVALQNSVLRRISPLVKVCFTLGFLLLTVSLQRYDWRGCTVFALCPFLFAIIGKIRVGGLFRMTLGAFPFVLCAGISNLFFDRTPVAVWNTWTLNGGVIALIVLLGKTLATVGMVMTLSAATPMQEISGVLVRLHVPCLLVLQVQFLFRYLFLLLEEARNVGNAYFLRNPAVRAVPLKDWGTLVGRLFLRSVERANCIYKAMQCRLFHAGNPLPNASKGSWQEWSAGALIFGGLILVRIYLVSAH